MTFEKRYQSVRGYLRYFAAWVAERCATEFDDAYQELFIRTWRAHTAYRKSRGVPFPAYCHKVLRNRAISLVATALREARRVPVVHLSEENAPEAYDCIREADSRIWVQQVCGAAIRDVGGVSVPGRILRLVQGGLSPADASREVAVSRQACNRAMTRQIRPVLAQYI